jgi:hypothetical protein
MQSSKPTKKTKGAAAAPAASEQAAKARSTESSTLKSTAEKSDTVKQSRKTGLSAPTPAAATHSDPPKQPSYKPVAHDEIAKLAYSFWAARGFQYGSPEEDWLRAERQLKN